ncbi:MAG: hypothetical protein WCH39_10315 [Schlesneria sp.]
MNKLISPEIAASRSSNVPGHWENRRPAKATIAASIGKTSG